MKATTGKAMQTSVAGVGLAQLKGRFDQWRAGRGTVLPAPPPNTVRIAVARELNLDYAVLKRRAAAVAGEAGDAPASTLATPRFVELLMPADPMTPARASQAQCVVEMANARGAKMRVELNGDALAGLPAMCSAFWTA